ncbi:c-type cytochrome [Sandarakinorhabdus sp. DWP1-3-1]|uniref:c-type cytochrome n=1 Tax=Sandarakinorhabdus sp. DWP1-3-1 TaxID=2804627 RepID=UPI003CFB4139
MTKIAFATIAAAAVSVATMSTPAAAAGDPVKGAAVFNQCKVCHVTDKGVNRVGPSLFGVVGRKAGTVPGYTYSAANKNSGLTWTVAQLDAYLAAPQKVVKGTKMAFAGLKKPEDRANVIAFLATKK